MSEKLLKELAETLGTPTAVSTGWGGFYVGSPVISEPSFPYHTEVAALVWRTAKSLYTQYPELDDRALLKLSIETSNVSSLQLTPEDWRLLEMAIQWLRNGPTPGANVRSSADGEGSGAG